MVSSDGTVNWIKGCGSFILSATQTVYFRWAGERTVAGKGRRGVFAVMDLAIHGCSKFKNFKVLYTVCIIVNKNNSIDSYVFCNKMSANIDGLNVRKNKYM